MNRWIQLRKINKVLNRNMLEELDAKFFGLQNYIIASTPAQDLIVRIIEFKFLAEDLIGRKFGYDISEPSPQEDK